MKSILTKVLTVVLIIVCFLVSWILYVSIDHLNMLQKNDIKTSMKFANEAKVEEMDSLLKEIEISTNQMYYYAMQELEASNPGFMKDKSTRDEYVAKIKGITLSTINNSSGVLAAYIRLNPDLFGSLEGFFLSYDPDIDKYVDMPCTDISLYDKDDVSHVGWYYEPLKAGEPIWMDVYRNDNIEVDMISYVIPIYYNDVTIGVIGMDVNAEYLRSKVSSIELYDSGYAFLVQENDDILYHPKYPDGVRKRELSEEFVDLVNLVDAEENEAKLIELNFYGKDVKLMCDKLRNNMKLCIVVPSSEFDKVRKDTVKDAMKFALPVALVGIILIIIMLYSIVAPLRKLAVISEDMEKGFFEADFNFKTNRTDEVGVLAHNFEAMATAMKSHFEYMNNVAFVDELTSLGNRNAYIAKEDEYVELVEEGKAMFTIVVMDVNNLKLINDHVGHEMGDRMLMRVATSIRDEFGKDKSYRIGGDEFVVLFPGIVEDIVDRINEFQTTIQEKSIQDFDDFEFYYSVACGYAVFDPEIDGSYMDTFRRADYMMYNDKQRLKEENPVYL
ncbi:MAG: diguanylate cyclase [Lachnospiraceae bacterium]|nr:diguanylate cyclase [Lachnospiraceae bacterium]